MGNKLARCSKRLPWIPGEEARSERGTSRMGEWKSVAKQD